MKTEALFFEGSEFVGSYALEHDYRWPSIALVCPDCGELWGREIHAADLPDTGSCSAWQTRSRRCVKCGDGQFLEGLSLEGASKDLLTRELLALIERELP